MGAHCSLLRLRPQLPSFLVCFRNFHLRSTSFRVPLLQHWHAAYESDSGKSNYSSRVFTRRGSRHGRFLRCDRVVALVGHRFRSSLSPASKASGAWTGVKKRWGEKMHASFKTRKVFSSKHIRSLHVLLDQPQDEYEFPRQRLIFRMFHLCNLTDTSG